MKVFISHSIDDKDFVRTLKRDLNENAINTWFDEDEIDIGDSLVGKLDAGLEESSHFLIVLSEASVHSDWVKYEINKVLANKESALLKKIIPIKYKPCETPKELSHLVFADLSVVTRFRKDGEIVFKSDQYGDVLDKICLSIRNSESTLTKEDKMKITADIKKADALFVDTVSNKYVKGVYRLQGFKSLDFRLKFAQDAVDGGGETSVDEVRPILLPPLLKFVLPNLKVGDILNVSRDYLYNEVAHFAGYRVDDTSINLDARIRKELRLIFDAAYIVEFDTAEKRLNFLKKVFP